jgi:hypothetical protein
VLADAGLSPEKDCERDVGQPEVRANCGQRTTQNRRAHKPVGDIPIHAPNAGGGVALVTQTPQAKKILWVALTVGIDLKDKGDFAFEGNAVAAQARLTVATIVLVDYFQAFPKLLLKAGEQSTGIIRRSVVDDEKREGFRPVLDFLKPFIDDLAHGGLLVKNGQDDEQFRRVGRHGGAYFYDSRLYFPAFGDTFDVAEVRFRRICARQFLFLLSTKHG